MLAWIFFLTFFLVQFSLPLPQGGRDAIAKNLVLREDQLPQKLLYPKTKKKINKQVIFPLYGHCFCFHTTHRSRNSFGHHLKPN